ncbi:MAG: hypothetical protein K5682_04195 [Lachnospiraceae bacterium]|nr:hypothetical protein [Lachnospiraceae bacterium]
MYVPLDALLNEPAKLWEIKDALEVELFVALPDMLREKDRDLFLQDMERILEAHHQGLISGVLMRCMEEYALCRIADGLKRMADGSLYQINAGAYEFFGSEEEGITLSPECTWFESKEFLDALEAKGTVPSMVELPVYGNSVLMVTANCIRNTTFKCDHVAGIRDPLIDRKGQKILYLTNCRYCQNVLFNSRPLSLHKKWDRVEKLPDYVTGRLTFTHEYDGMIADRLTLFLSGTEKGIEPVSYTTGHFIKGVL